MHCLALAGLLPAVFAVPGASVDGAARLEAPIVTEAEFLSGLDPSHPAAAESAAALAVARARVTEAAAFENPVLAVVREDPDGPVAQTDWTVSWQLPDAGRTPRIEARRQTAGAAAERLSQDLLALRLEMRAVYADWAFADARHERLAQEAGRLEALAERETARAERGETSGLEARRLVLAAAGLRARTALADADARAARARAAGWSPSLADGARPVRPPLPPAPALAADHPLIRAAEADLAAATLERRAARRFVRSPELTAGWQRQEAGAESLSGALVGLAWSLPVLDRNQGRQAAAEAHIARAEARLERLRREIGSTRTGALAIYERLAAALDDARTSLDGNERMLEGAEAAFRYGEASLADLLETRRAVLEAGLSVLELHRAALAAHRELERLAGNVEPPEDTSNPTPEDPQP